MCLFATILLAGCGDKAGDDKSKDASSSIEKADNTDTKAPKLEAVQTTHNFGSVKQGEKIEHIFKIKNAGDAELKIERARGS